ncbi:MAG: hypothetical protein A3K03_11970 [Bdellovibrionales bacterium RIFOXYD1_FULL_44_7]|nr:MAG: hypothetical protein A3K03_11970 [Bdellovibrionales bacterium RIFOXYD1_FULL_44_7]
MSGPAVEKDYKTRSGRPLSLSEISAAALAGDRHAQGVIDLFLDSFARGIANVINIIDPDLIVLGGGVSNLDCLYDEGVKRIGTLVFNDELATPVVRNKLGDSAGVFGAAVLALQG